MDERTAARLELAGARARLVFGCGGDAAAHHESAAEASAQLPASHDLPALVAQIQHNSNLDPVAAGAVAADIVRRAADACLTLDQGAADTDLSEDDAMALESVLQVRGRPALRVLGHVLEPLSKHVGSNFWQLYIESYEARIIGAASATGAAVVSAFVTGNPPWVQGSAWLTSANRVVTNRHLLFSPANEIRLIEPDGAGGMRLKDGHQIDIDFTRDDRTPATNLRRRVKQICYVADLADPVDIAVMEIEPCECVSPLVLSGDAPPDDLLVVGHPSLTTESEKVLAVFGKLDGHKRVSFGKRLAADHLPDRIVYDASTVGGYSGGPVVAISSGTVAGVHYFGDPVAGNVAFTSSRLKNHPAYQFLAAANT